MNIMGKITVLLAFVILPLMGVSQAASAAPLKSIRVGPLVLTVDYNSAERTCRNINFDGIKKIMSAQCMCEKAVSGMVTSSITYDQLFQCAREDKERATCEIRNHNGRLVGFAKNNLVIKSGAEISICEANP